MNTGKLYNDIKEGLISPEEAVKEAETRMGGRVYAPKGVDQRREQYAASRRLRGIIQQNKVPFIYADFLPNFFLSQGLVLVGGKSGRSKTTTGANLIAGFLKNCPGKSAIVISNEEAPDALYERVACVLTQNNYLDLFHGRMKAPAQEAVYACIDKILPRLEVVTEGDHWDMSQMEDVQAVLETAAKNKVGMVLIDYLQTITGSRLDPQAESFAVSKKLGFYFKEYGKRNGVPVIVLAQLADNGGAEFSSRIQNDKTIFNHAFIAVEVIPDFEASTAKFLIQKDRFCGCTGKEVTMNFRGGSYYLGEEL